MKVLFSKSMKSSGPVEAALTVTHKSANHQGHRQPSKSIKT